MPTRLYQLFSTFHWVPVPSHESEMSCARSIDFTSFLDFGTAHTVWYFLYLILFQCSLLLFVCVLGFKKNSETLYLCCILYKLHICVLLRVVCQSWFVSTGYWIGGPHQWGCQVIIRIALRWTIVGRDGSMGRGPLNWKKYDFLA